MNKFYIIGVAIISVLSLVGCQKNSYESCVDFQTKVSTYYYEKDKARVGPLFESTELRVAINCKGVN